MKILFVTENLSDRCGANVNIVLTLVRRLSADTEVSLLTRFDQGSPIDDEKTKLFSNVFSFESDQLGYINAHLKSQNWRKLSSIQKCKYILTHPKVLLYMLDAKYNDFYFTRRRYKAALEKVCKENRFDAVIGVTAPYYIARAVSDAKIDCAKTIFQLDPYTYNYTLPARQTKHRARIEKKLIKKMDSVFAVSFVRDEMLSKGIATQASKVTAFELPGILVDSVQASRSDEIQKDSGAVRFMFIGQFYDDIRNPEFLLKLFMKLPSHYELHLVGGGAEGVVEKYQEKLGERLVRYGWLSSTEAREKMYEADVLINLNNTIENQLASKLFEYVSTGKPILNICKRENCLSLKYSGKYHRCIDVFEKDVITDDTLQRIVAFVSNNRSLNREDILAAFKENTDVYVAQILKDELSVHMV